jgi:hypothetical protein
MRVEDAMDSIVPESMGVVETVDTSYTTHSASSDVVEYPDSSPRRRGMER